jgi:glutaminase
MSGYQPDAFPARGTISTGALPETGQVRDLVDQAYARFRDNADGEVSNVYPALERVPPDLFGICLVGENGRIYETGDTAIPFTIMSVSKPFVFALVCQEIGSQAVRERIGVNATGLPFNSVAAVEQGEQGRTNPMVNPGAIATTSLVPGSTRDERRAWIQDGLSRFAGRRLAVNEEVYQSAIQTNHRNRGLANLLVSLGRIEEVAEEAVDLYTWQCALDVTARDLAVMGATFAFGGVNPLTGEQVVGREVCHHALAVMITAGMYETSGDWLYDVGLPGKSGIGGGIVTVSPGKGGMGTFAPRLDAAGNSVKGQLVARYLSRQLGLDLLVS